MEHLGGAGDGRKDLLFAVLATPATTSGERTAARLDLARKILGFERVDAAVEGVWWVLPLDEELAAQIRAG